MASIIRTCGLKLAKSLGIVVFLFLILFNIKLIISDDNSDFSFLGLTIELNETKAAPIQKSYIIRFVTIHGVPHYCFKCDGNEAPECDQFTTWYCYPYYQD